MAKKDNSEFNFDKNVDDSFVKDDKFVDESSKNGDMNSLDNNIGLDELEYNHKKEDMYARHEIIKNIYSSLIKMTKPWVLIALICITVIVYPLSRVELPFGFGKLLMNYLKVFYELITACLSFILGAIVSNWISRKIEK